MAKYYGAIGYQTTVEREDETGVYEERITERKYYGDVLKPHRRLESSSFNLNDNITVSNQISILADAYAYQHFSDIRYADWMGVLWKVVNVEMERPRLILTLGGVYNGYEERSSSDTGGCDC